MIIRGSILYKNSRRQSVVIPNDELEKGNDNLTVGEILSMGKGAYYKIIYPQ